MTEQEWLTSDDPEAMLRLLVGSDANEVEKWYGTKQKFHLTDRKLRLFACACCRQIWDKPADERSRKAVEVAERFADGQATKEELATARSVARSVARDVARDVAWYAARYAARDAARSVARDVARDVARAKQAAILRDICGNPWRPVKADPIWFAWRNGTVLAISTAIYDQRRFEDMPILADALEEAGCQDANILYHLRNICRHCTDDSGICWGKVADCRHCGGTGVEDAPHVRGCWALDCILGKE